MMKYTNPQLREICRAQHIHNDWNFAKGAVFITRTPATTGRAYHSAHYSVTKIGERLSNDWGQESSKEFPVYGRKEDKATFESAKAFATKKFGITEWAKTPFGGYCDKSFVEKRLAEIVARHEKGAVNGR